tara:strand:+ start:208 stop:588 length:381 start_codon:yes stop_codon:yes gene_type:complete
MRIDQFLWYVRIFKSRNIASNYCKKGFVKINSQTAKPSKDPYVGDIISVRKNQIWYTFIIIDFPKNRVSAKWVSVYIQQTTSTDEFKVQNLQQLAKDEKRKKGTGRPTKKERRKIDEIQSWDSKEE